MYFNTSDSSKLSKDPNVVGFPPISEISQTKTTSFYKDQLSAKTA